MGDTNDDTDASERKYEITIKRLHSATYSLFVYQSLPIIALKLVLSCASGVIPDLQHLLFRGRVLEDDKLVSDYHIEQGHTLYLVSRRTFPSLPQRESSNAVANDNSNLGLGTLNENQSHHSYHTTSTGRWYVTPDNVFPDSYRYVTQYLNHLIRNNEQDSGNSRENRMPSSVQLDRILQNRRQLLVGELAQCLSNISAGLVDHANLTDRSSERLRQGIPTESEMLLNNLGNSLIELGRATSRISMGERPVASRVSRLLTSQSQMQTSTREGNLPVATTAPRNEILRNVRVGFLWPSPSSPRQVSSPQLTTEEELENPDLEDEMEGLEDPDPEEEMVNTVTSQTYI